MDNNSSFNLQAERQKFPKISKSKFIFHKYIEKKTLVFDFDETLAKVSFEKNELPEYAEQVDILTKKSTINVN